jgi:hypothetical protein
MEQNMKQKHSLGACFSSSRYRRLIRINNSKPIESLVGKYTANHNERGSKDHKSEMWKEESICYGCHHAGNPITCSFENIS